MSEYVDAGAFLAAEQEVVACYAAAFCAPPWNEDPARARDFGATLAAHAARPGFTASFARDGDGRLVGFGYGFTTPDPFPDHGAYATVRRMLGPAVDRLAGALEVVELAVRPEFQRGGHGRRLLADVVGEEPAWLLTVTQVQVAVAFYDRLGWRRAASDPTLTVYTGPRAA